MAENAMCNLCIQFYTFLLENLSLTKVHIKNKFQCVTFPAVSSLAPGTFPPASLPVCKTPHGRLGSFGWGMRRSSQTGS